MNSGTDLPTVSGAAAEPNLPEVTVQDKLNEMARLAAKREAAEQKRHDNHQRKRGTPTERAITCRVCHKSFGTLLHSGDGYIHRNCQRRLDAGARRGQ